MAIPPRIKIKKDHLPDTPGVYFYYDAEGQLLYIGKATSLKKRVSSYFSKAHDNRIAELVSRIARIEYIQTQTVIEALVLEANKIKEFQPYFNILQRDDKSFLYLVFTNEDFPKPLFLRGHDLAKMGINPFDQELSVEAKKRFLAVYGPYTSGRSVRKALDFLRKIFPWSTCDSPEVTGKKKACFYKHIRLCPGVCSGEISRQEYRKTIRNLMDFFEGKKVNLIGRLKKEMQKAAAAEDFERAAHLRDEIFSLEHIQDIAIISKEDVLLPFSTPRTAKTAIDLEGRIEAYDISNISGTSAVGSMVVFEEGESKPSAYRIFHIKTVEGANDTAMMEEVLRRRLKRAEQYPKAWKLPELMVIDGGKPQVNRVQQILTELGVDVPILGLAKGPDRKQDRLVYDRANTDVMEIAQRGKELFQKARDEAHRFAVKHHRMLRAKNYKKALKRPRKKTV